MRSYSRPTSWKPVGIATALSAAAVFALAGCSAPAAEEETGPVTLTFAYEIAGDVNPFEAVADLYTEQNPEVTFEFIGTAVEDYPNVLRTQLQAGNAPDLISGSSGKGNLNAILTYAEAGYMLDLTEYPFVTDRVPENSRALFYDEDEKVYGFPLSATVVGMAANLDAYADADLEPATTWDEMLEQCATVASSGAALMTVGTTRPANAGLFIMQLAANTVYAEDPDWNEKRAAGEVTFADSEGWITALEQVAELSDAGCFPAGIEQAGGDDTVAALAAGQVLQRPGPSATVAELQDTYPDGSFGMVAIPAETESNSRVTASLTTALGINASSERTQAAVDFLEFFATPEASDAYAAGYNEVSLTAFEDGVFPEQYAAMADALAQPDKVLPLQNLGFPNGAVYEAFGVGFQGLLTGQASVDDVLAAADAAWDQ